MHRVITINQIANKHFYRTGTSTELMDSLETIFSIQKELASMMDLSRYFVVQASIELGMTPADVVNVYKKKNSVNRERQTSGY